MSEEFQPIDIVVKPEYKPSSKQECRSQKIKNMVTNTLYSLGGWLHKLNYREYQYYSVLGRCFSSKKDAIKFVKTVIWFTYRNEIPQLTHSTYRSDTGWGCMIRVAQMMFAQVLKTHYGVSDKSKTLIINTVLNGFLDDDENRSSIGNYSIQKIIKITESKFQKKAGSWFSSKQVALALKYIHEKIPVKGSENLSFVISDHVIFYEEIIKKLGHKLCECNTRTIYCRKCHKVQKSKKSVFLIFLTTLNLTIKNEKEDVNTRDVVMKLLEMQQSVGIIGGKPNKALYLIGSQNKEKLIYLDPHVVQRCVNRKNVSQNFQTFFCDQYRTLEFCNLDPSVGFGFYFKDLKALSEFHFALEGIKGYHEKQFFMFREWRQDVTKEKTIKQIYEQTQTNQRQNCDSQNDSYILDTSFSIQNDSNDFSFRI